MMMRLIWMIGLIGLMAMPATASDLDLGGLGDLAADLAKRAQAGALFDLQGGKSGALWIKIWTYHDAIKLAEEIKDVEYATVGLGGRLREGGVGSPLLILAFNGPAISGWLWRSHWSQTHIRRLALPPIWFGPYVTMPIPGKTWVAGQEAGGFVSVGL